jgi:glycosyltransferase involved in cell wall biosynthesis
MKNEIQRVVIWQNYPSIHQSAFVRALAALPGMAVWFAHEEDLPEARKEMGWVVPDFGAARVKDVRDPEAWESLAALNDPETCHVFGSYFLLPRAYAAFKRLRPSPCRLVWITEAFNFHGLRGQIRLLRARWHVRREVRDRFHRVFAMGELGLNFFRRAGVEAGQLREFGYLVEPPLAQESESEGPDRDFRFLFVGQLIPRKGADLLLRAAGQLNRDGWSLSLIGEGSERARLEGLANEPGLRGRIKFLGGRTNPETLRAIGAADVLVLPSRWDGWGAVVNEALMLGTPVIVSDRCGSSSLVVHPSCGRVFRLREEPSLARALAASLDEGKINPRQRAGLKAWAAQALGAPRLARYFLRSLGPEIESSPWRNLGGLD